MGVNEVNISWLLLLVVEVYVRTVATTLYITEEYVIGGV